MALRTPNPLTPYEEEENASMSELLGGGPSSSGGNGRGNGGGRTQGSAPASQPGAAPTARVRTPRDIMLDRAAREARKKAESDEARLRYAEEEAEPRPAELRQGSGRGDAAAGVAVGSSMSGGGPQYGQDSFSIERRGGRASGGGGGRIKTDPPTRAQPAAYAPSGSRAEPMAPRRDQGNGVSAGASRARAPSIPQAQARPAQQQQPAASSYQPPQSQPATQQSQTRAGTGAGASTARAQQGASAGPSSQPAPGAASDGSRGRNTNRSSFPHAFERWETLSSHWEGLTSYWIRRLQENSSDINNQPLNQQMSRQITDLSAAGANLFHAVVELQRLRASSERKFQRWFFDTREDQERAKEIQGGLEAELRREREARAELQRNLNNKDSEKLVTAEKMLIEMRRELQISKEEARRAWEELGRREQEERDRTTSLRDGQPTIVGGVQVLPMAGAPSRQGSTNRPSTREGPYPGGPTATRMGGQTDTQTSTADRVQAYVDTATAPYEPSLTSTADDPFYEGARQAAGPVQHNETGLSTQGGSATTTTNANPPSTSVRSYPVIPPSQTIPSTLGASTSATARANPSSLYQHEGISLQGPEGSAAPDAQSFLSRPSEEGTFSDGEYEIDEHGEYRLDPSGRRIPYPYRPGTAPSEESDEMDVHEAAERERQYQEQYNQAARNRAAAAAVARQQQGASGQVYGGDGFAGTQVDYSGSGYGSGWENVPRHAHHHPTRLSDVLEEEDERSRTSPSRVSQDERGGGSSGAVRGLRDLGGAPPR